MHGDCQTKVPNTACISGSQTQNQSICVASFTATCACNAEPRAQHAEWLQTACQAPLIAVATLPRDLASCNRLAVSPVHHLLRPSLGSVPHLRMTAEVEEMVQSRRCSHSARAISWNSALHLSRPSQRRCRLSRLPCSALIAPAAAAEHAAAGTDGACKRRDIRHQAGAPLSTKAEHSHCMGIHITNADSPRHAVHQLQITHKRAGGWFSTLTREQRQEVCIRLCKQLQRHLCRHAASLHWVQEGCLQRGGGSLAGHRLPDAPKQPLRISDHVAVGAPALIQRACSGSSSSG